MFAIEMLPAQQGDALWIEYGSAAKPHRILIDGGTPRTFAAIRDRVLALPPTERRFELLIVTHIDTDHIGGILRLLSDQSLGLTFKDVWFNAWPQIAGIGREHVLGAPVTANPVKVLGPKDGELLNRLLDLRGNATSNGWNRAFGSAKDARVAIPDEGSLPVATLAGGMTMTILGPSLARLRKLRDEWERVIRDTKITDPERKKILDAAAKSKGVLGAGDKLKVAADRKFESDDTPANGSSIVVLAEYEGKRALLTGDGYAGEIEKGIARYLADQNPRPSRLQVDLVKLPHHGSRKNTSLPMLRKIECGRFLVSSSGAVFGHPDFEAIARVLVTNGPGLDLGFDYDVTTTKGWRSRALQTDPNFHYTARYPAAGGTGLRTEL
jgi:hypothetical protein